MNYSNSQLQAYKTCPLSYYLRYEVGLEKVEDEAGEHDLRFGSAIHEGLKRIYLNDTLESAITGFKELYPVQLKPEDYAKTQETGILALREYAHKWSEEDKKWRILSVEEREF